MTCQFQKLSNLHLRKFSWCTRVEKRFSVLEVFKICQGIFKNSSYQANDPRLLGSALYDSRCFTNKEIIGNGAYGAVFTADVPFARKNGEANATVEKVVVKKMLSDDVLDKKTFIKEERILQRLEHPNIVDFKGICNNPFALVLEYVYLDFKPFGVEQKVSSLAQFLGVLEGFAECYGFDSPHVISTICKDMAYNTYTKMVSLTEILSRQIS